MGVRARAMILSEDGKSASALLRLPGGLRVTALRVPTMSKLLLRIASIIAPAMTHRRDYVITGVLYHRLAYPIGGRGVQGWRGGLCGQVGGEEQRRGDLQH